MSTLGRVGVSVPDLSEAPLDTNQIRVRKLEQKSDGAVGRDAVSVTGTVDPTRPKGSPLTDGITLAAGASLNIAHGLGRPAIGFLPLVSAGSVTALANASAGLAADMAKKFVRVTNTGVVPITFKLQVF